MRKSKWFFCCSYNPNKSSIDNYLYNIFKNLDFYASKHDNLLLMADYNSEITENAMRDFTENHSLKSLIKTPTCFKNPQNPSTIDLILTNKEKTFLQYCCYRNRTLIFPQNDIDCYENLFSKTITKNCLLLRQKEFFK